MASWPRILPPPPTNRDITSYKPVEAVVGTQPLSPDSPSVNAALPLASCMISDKILNFSGPPFQVSWYSTPKHIINFQYYYKDGAKSFLLSPPLTKWSEITEKMLPGWEKKLKSPGSSWKQVLFFILSKIKEVKPASSLSQSEVVKRPGSKKRGYFGRNYWTDRWRLSFHPPLSSHSPSTRSASWGLAMASCLKRGPDVIGARIRGSRKCWHTACPLFGEDR